MQQEALIGLFTLSGTLGGILIGSIFTTIGINIREKNETKRVLEGFAYNLAKEYWAKAVKMADKRGGAVDPLESFIISVKTLMKLTEKDRLDEETIKEILSEHSQVMSVVKKHYDKK